VRIIRVDERIRRVVGPVGTHRTTYVVFDQAERLTSLPVSFFAGLFSLRELTGLNVCPVFVSQLTFSQYAPPSVFARGVPVSVFFPMYTIGELVEIISLHRPSQWNSAVGGAVVGWSPFVCIPFAFALSLSTMVFFSRALSRSTALSLLTALYMYTHLCVDTTWCCTCVSFLCRCSNR
jgi:hypothetical protein